MKKAKFIISQNIVWFSFLFIFSGCNDSSRNKNTLGLINSDLPINLTDTNTSFYKEINYGTSSNNSFDIFVPNVDQRTPLVIFIHGGGFVSGDKSHAYNNKNAKRIRTFLNNDIAFATVNYRFISDSESNGVITSLNDCKKSLQFIRYHAEEFNIDKERIGIYGSSAGAGASLWIGFHDDMKELQSEDQILRESTRVQVVGAIEAQATYDLIKWETIVFKPFNITLDNIANSGMVSTILAFYNINAIEELYLDRMESFRENIDFLELMSNDDPPIWVSNSEYEVGFPKSKKDINHHPFHAKILREQADNIGLEGLFYIPKLKLEDTSFVTLTEYFIKKLK